jgi:inner membrane protein involved in colicin E2 resistance
MQNQATASATPAPHWRPRLLLASLYGYLVAIVRAGDYALLGGALALFGGLGLAMYRTGRVDWMMLGLPEDAVDAPS